MLQKHGFQCGKNNLLSVTTIFSFLLWRPNVKSSVKDNTGNEKPLPSLRAKPKAMSWPTKKQVLI